MTSFVIKLITNPLGLWLSAVLFTGLEFGRWHQPVWLGLILAIVGVALELLFLRRGTLYLSTVLDLAAVTLLVYYVTPFFDGATSTFMSALLTGVLFFFVEYALHRHLIRTGKTQKSR